MKKIAILDSGIDFKFKEFNQSKIEVKDFVNETTEIARDENGHGTACCGEIIKICPEAEMLVIKVLNRMAKSSLGVLYDALEYCLERDDIAVINISSSCLLTEQDIADVFEELINELVNDGKIVVASVINSLEEGIKFKSFPASYKNVIGVWHHYGESRKIYYEKNGNECLCYGSYNLMPFLNGHYYFFKGNSSFSARIAAILYKEIITNEIFSLEEIIREVNKEFKIADDFIEKKSKAITEEQRILLQEAIEEVLTTRGVVEQNTCLDDLTQLIEEEDCLGIAKRLSEKLGSEIDYKIFDVEDFRSPERLLVKISGVK